VEEPRLSFFELVRGVSFFFSPPPSPVYSTTLVNQDSLSESAIPGTIQMVIHFARRGGLLK
jgi:hypothetical protein